MKRSICCLAALSVLVCGVGCTTRVDTTQVTTPYGSAKITATEGPLSSSSNITISHRDDLDVCIEAHKASWGADVDPKCREMLGIPSRQQLFYGPYGQRGSDPEAERALQRAGY